MLINHSYFYLKASEKYIFIKVKKEFRRFNPLCVGTRLWCLHLALYCHSVYISQAQLLRPCELLHDD